MATKNYVVGCFEDEKNLFHAIDNLQKENKKIHDVYTPFAVHGLDEKLKMKQTKLHIAGFFYGMIGTITSVFFMSWIFTTDWPINFGGKPFWALPAFVPIIFEVTVLFSAVGMVLTFCYLCQLAPFVKKETFHIRATDDLLVIAVESENAIDSKRTQAILKKHSAIEIKNQTREERDWWFGLFNKSKMLFEK